MVTGYVQSVTSRGYPDLVVTLIITYTLIKTRVSQFYYPISQVSYREIHVERCVRAGFKNFPGGTLARQTESCRKKASAVEKSPGTWITCVLYLFFREAGFFDTKVLGKATQKFQMNICQIVYHMKYAY